MLYVLYKDYFKKQFFSTGKSLSESFYCLRNLLYAIAIEKKLAIIVTPLTRLTNCNHVQKIYERLRKLRKSGKLKQNINRIYNEQMNYKT